MSHNIQNLHHWSFRSGEEMDINGLDITINDLIKNTLEIRQDLFHYILF